MIEHHTVDGDKLCPHPGMTDEDLEDFEHWADKEVSSPVYGWWHTFAEWFKEINEKDSIC